MQFTVNGKNIEITPAIREYAEEKIGKIVKHNNQIMNIKVTLSVTKNPSVKKNHTAEVVCFLSGSTIRVTEDAESMYAAIDLLADRLDRQVKEHKEKLVRAKSGASIRTEGIEEEMSEVQEEIEEESEIIE